MIDAHQQFYKNITSKDLRKEFLVPELELDLDLSGVDQVISVQSRSCVEENELLIEQGKLSDGLVAAIVGWAPLTSDKLQLYIDQYIYEPLMKGFRENMIGTPDEQFLDNADFDHGVNEIHKRGYTYDLQVSHDQLPAAIAFVDRHPNIHIALNHCGNPPVAAEDFPQAWARNIREIARRPHVYCKISGLATGITDGSTVSSDLLQPYFNTILKAFKPNRLMFASDWPNMLDTTAYPAWLNTMDELMLPLSEDEKSAINEDTTIEFYQL